MGIAKDTVVTGVHAVSVQRMLNALQAVLTSHKSQVAVGEFDSFKSMNIMCPYVAYYVDERYWRADNEATGTTTSGVKTDEFWKDVDSRESNTEKAEVIGGYIKCVLRQALRLDREEKIGDDANLQDMGVDSLMTIELKNSIQTLLGDRLILNVNDFKNRTTVKHMSIAIVEKMGEDTTDENDNQTCEPLSAEELKSLVVEDARLPKQINVTNAPPSALITSVLITGATGKLGPYIISLLVRDYPMIKRIVCLVRDVNDSNSALGKVIKKLDMLKLGPGLEKVECIVGNVALERLGMTKEIYKQLSEQTHGVIHCAASASYTEPYRRLSKGKINNVRSINVIGTKNILRFACTGLSKRVYFASNFLCGIFGNESLHLPDIWVSDDVLDWIAENNLPGLLASKLICEVLLRQAVQRGIPCKVFRFPWIAGDSENGRLNPIDNLYILRYLSFLKMKAVPTMPLPANLLPVDLCAALSLKLFFNEYAPCEVYNIGHPHPPVEQEFVEVAKDVFGVNLELIEWQELSKRMEESGDKIVKELNKGQGSFYNQIAEAVGMAKGYFVSPHTYFTNEKLTRLVPNYENEIPPAMEILKKDMTYLKQSGLVEKFGI